MGSRHVYYEERKWLVTSGMPGPSGAQTVQLQCPNCGTTFTADVFNLVDVTAEPQLKSVFLSGQINLAVCPSCGFASMLGTPLTYHDAAKQLFLVYFPQELNLPAEDQERFIGGVSSVLMQSLPADVPKSYLLTPQRFMSLQSLVDAVLDAEGISREVRDKQRRVVEVISALAEAVGNNDDAAFAQAVEANRDALDEEFFTILGMYTEASRREQREETAQLLEQVAEKLGEQGFEMQPGEGDAGDLSSVIERLEQATDDQLAAVLSEVRPLIDYAFFQTWTARIEELQMAGDTATAERLTQRRQQILETVEAMDKQAQAMFDAGSQALREVLSADDPRAALEGLGARLDDAFMLVLSANQTAAERAGQSEIVERLNQIGALALEVIQSKLSPTERLINELMLAESPRESTSILRRNAAMVTPELVKQLNELADEHAERGSTETSEQLRRFAREAGAMLF